MIQSASLMFGTSEVIGKVLDKSIRYARSRHSILILGEAGTGKTILARHLHQLSGRPGSFVKTSVSAIPKNLEISQLAGHRRGAFTGAWSDRKGLVEAAQHGTFFLDELGLASRQVQELLLHLLEDGSIRRVGDVRDVPVDVRFIAATNADLDRLVQRGRFRKDLRDRFGYFVLRLPPLRDRHEDIIPLAEHFLAAEARAAGLGSVPNISQEVRNCLLAAPWPGNIRDLRSVCDYALTHAISDAAIEVEHLPSEFMATLGSASRFQTPRSSGLSIHEALQRTGGNKARAARMLGISRAHFYRLLPA